MKITIIGAGNIADYICKQLMDSLSFKIVQLYARNIEDAKLFEKTFNLSITNNIEDINTASDIYIFAVNDKAIAPLAHLIKRPQAICIHCAGSQSLDLLAAASAQTGLIWPLYSITKEQEKYEQALPLIVDANNTNTLEVIKLLAAAISPNVSIANFAQRKYLHLNAVLVNNFTNHLMAIAEQICNQHDLDFHTLIPIIQQTTQRALMKSPAKTQTGPAIRHDSNTMETQLALLQAHPDWQNIYKSISESIQAMYPIK